MLSLSVVIPSYNRASELDKTLHSLTQQSTSDFHTILVDHGSTDTTEEIYQKYTDRLHISYYKIERNEADGYSPAIPRDFGIRRSEDQLIVSLDTGMLLPSHYIEAHRDFHSHHKNYVGIGLQHGLDAQRSEIGEDFTAFLKQAAIEQAYSALANADLQDQRSAIHLEKTRFPWFFAWTANISLPRAAYLAVNGFNPDLKGWGFEDVDLAYRLSKHGLHFAFVEGGWGVELPQPRTPMQARLKSNRENMLRSYSQQRSLAIESLLLHEMLLRTTVEKYRALPTNGPEAMGKVREIMRSQFTRYSEEIFLHLTEVGHNAAHAQPVQQEVRAGLAGPALLIGGTRQQAEGFEYLALADETVCATPSTWSCSGTLIPLPEQSLDTVVVTDIWPQLDWAPSYPLDVTCTSLLEVLISEIQRTARRAVFLQAPGNMTDRQTMLEKLCQQYGLAFQLVNAS